MKNIMVDIDDVLMGTMQAIHRLAFEAGLHDGSVEPQWRGWEAYGCEEQVYWDLWSDFALSDGYVTTPPIEEAAQAVRRLHFAGHNIHLVTARGFMNHAEDIRRWTVEWVEEWAIPHRSLTFAQDKPAAAIELIARPFDFAIDDSPKNVQALRDAGTEAYLLTHSHNRDHQGLPRVETVSEFADLTLQEEA